MQKRIEFLGMKGPTRDVAETANAMLFWFRHVLSAYLFQPSRRFLGSLEIKQTRVEDVVSVDLAVGNGNDPSLCAECLEYRNQSIQFGLLYQVGLANQQYVSKLHLVNQ